MYSRHSNNNIPRQSFQYWATILKYSRHSKKGSDSNTGPLYYSLVGTVKMYVGELVVLIE